MQDPNYRHVLCITFRPGLAFYTRYLELTYFHPNNKDLNDLYDQRFFKWEDLQLTLVTVPASFDSVLHEAAKATNMRLVDRALPVLIGGDGMERLPLHEEYLYTMENGDGYLVYTKGHDAAGEQQDKDIQALEDEKLVQPNFHGGKP